MGDSGFPGSRGNKGECFNTPGSAGAPGEKGDKGAKVRQKLNLCGFKLRYITN